MARFYRVRPSDLLNGDLESYNVDMVMGLAALTEAQGDVKGMSDELLQGIAAAVAAGTRLGA